jgi:ubiquinone/menaquinone biosynthesis C-methylase UbiE
LFATVPVTQRFDPKNASKLENPERLKELPPAVVIELLRLRGAETVVDYGAGTGMYSVPLAEALPHGRVIAVEALPELIAIFETKLTDELRARVQIVQTDRNKVPLADGAADRVLLINVLHHINDDPAALAEIARLLAPGGLLVDIEFGQMERPVGPPSDHVLSGDEVRALIAGMGLRELEWHEPATILMYHLALVAQKPA